VCCGWGKDLTLLPLWVNTLFVGLLEAICGLIGGWGLVWVGYLGERAVLGLK